jgi:flagellar biosynthesis/type III secretory pathway chaperone
MEPDNLMSKETYVHMMADSLKRKQGALDELLDLTKQQSDMLSLGAFEEEQFEKLFLQKDELIKILNQLDSGFEQLYERVREELQNHREKYALEITEMKERIKAVTDVSVELQTMEIRNRSMLERQFSAKRENIRKSRVSNKTAANYYKTMTKQHNISSFFYDKKK